MFIAACIMWNRGILIFYLGAFDSALDFNSNHAALHTKKSHFLNEDFGNHYHLSMHTEGVNNYRSY